VGDGDDEESRLLQLTASSMLRAHLLEALGWRVAHLPFHLWASRGGDDRMLLAMLDQAVGAPLGGPISGGGGKSGKRDGAAARAAARRVLASTRRVVEARGEARRLQEHRQRNARGGGVAAGEAGQVASLAALLAGLEGSGGGGGALSTFDRDDFDDLYLDPDLLSALGSGTGGETDQE
jgi:hypothetical protein